jgi:transcription initiation factor TFIIH subunit 4
MNINYQKGLHDALIGVCEHASFGKPCDTSDKHEVTKQFLDQYALTSWENVLHYLVGTSQDKKAPAVLQLLEKSGLMTKVSGEIRITSKGFQFLLQEMKLQVWALLLQYLELSQSLQMEPVEVLNFLFQLGSLEFGQDYSVDTLTVSQKHMLSDLKYLGLVFQRNKKSSRFYPTRLATLLASGPGEYALADLMEANATTTALDKKGFILLETNFKVYAYTSSPLQIAILSLFISMQARFPNMVVGMITRDSIREAMTRGITADQVISFLSTHAHPEMRTSVYYIN